MILSSFRPMPWASYQWTSALPTVPSAETNKGYSLSFSSSLLRDRKCGGGGAIPGWPPDGERSRPRRDRLTTSKSMQIAPLKEEEKRCRLFFGRVSTITAER